MVAGAKSAGKGQFASEEDQGSLLLARHFEGREEEGKWCLPATGPDSRGSKLMYVRENNCSPGILNMLRPLVTVFWGMLATNLLD